MTCFYPSLGLYLRNDFSRNDFPDLPVLLNLSIDLSTLLNLSTVLLVPPSVLPEGGREFDYIWLCILSTLEARARPLSVGLVEPISFFEEPYFRELRSIVVFDPR